MSVEIRLIIEREKRREAKWNGFFCEMNVRFRRKRRGGFFFFFGKDQIGKGEREKRNTYYTS